MQGLKLFPTTDEHGRLRVKLVGEFDLAGIEHFREVVIPAIDSAEQREIEFDLGRLTFMDSSGLHALAEVDRAMRARCGTVNVVGAPPHLVKLFQVSGLDRVLTIVPHSIPASRAA
jgi:anti-anti-sigma factor